MKFISGNENYDEKFICSHCTHHMFVSKGFWKCENEECNFLLCRLCHSDSFYATCPTCKKKLDWRTDLSGEYSNSIFRCDLCKESSEWKHGVHHCSDHKFDMCVKCRSSMKPDNNVYVAIESQRWWLNKWTDCGCLPGGLNK